MYMLRRESAESESAARHRHLFALQGRGGATSTQRMWRDVVTGLELEPLDVHKRRAAEREPT